MNLEDAVAELKAEVGNSNDEVEAKSGELETANIEIDNLNTEILKIKAEGTSVSKNTDPAIVENKVIDQNLTFFNALANSIKKRA